MPGVQASALACSPLLAWPRSRPAARDGQGDDMGGIKTYTRERSRYPLGYDTVVHDDDVYKRLKST